MIIKYKTSGNIVCTLLMTGKQDWCILQIRTHLTYIANAKKSCHMKKQSHRFESMRKACISGCQVPLKNDVSHGIRWCNLILTLERKLQTHVSPTIEGFLQCNGRKLEEAEDFKCVFVLCARDLIFFTTDFQTVNSYSTIHC